MSGLPKLLQPLKLGNIQLHNRVVLAPLTRLRANKSHAHGDLGVEYYRQRSSTPGSLLVTEATFISPEAGGYDHAPGLWSDEQLAGWKRVSDSCASVEQLGQKNSPDPLSIFKFFVR